MQGHKRTADEPLTDSDDDCCIIVEQPKPARKVRRVHWDLPSPSSIFTLDLDVQMPETHPTSSSVATKPMEIDLTGILLVILVYMY